MLLAYSLARVMTPEPFWTAGLSCLRNDIQKCGVVLVLHMAMSHAIAHLLLVKWQARR